MKRRIILFASMLLLLAALSATDAEIVRDLEFYESMDALATEDLEAIQTMGDENEELEDNKEVSNDP
jgi:hypothetical protein